VGHVISIFNNKGGVGKTTILWNLADTLGRAGKQVLLVDFDPQCNLSIAMLGEAPFTAVLPTQNQPYGTTIRAFLQRFLQNTGGEEVFVHIGPNTHANVHLIAGDFWLNVYAEQLSLGADLLTGTGIAKYVVLRRLIAAAEASAGIAFDYVLLDLPPSFGSLVRAALYSSDYFLVPCTSDNFSAYCVGLIGQMLPIFVQDWTEGLARFKQANPFYADYDLLGRPVFAGWVYNGFDRRAGAIVPADRVHQANIETKVANDLVGPLRTINLVANGLAGPYQVGQIEDMNVLVQNSLLHSAPVSQLGNFRQVQGLGAGGGWSQSQRGLIGTLGGSFNALSNNVQLYCV
jgi:cellulose biosynthesis protein BcsQ